MTIDKVCECLIRIKGENYCISNIKTCENIGKFKYAVPIYSKHSKFHFEEYYKCNRKYKS